MSSAELLEVLDLAGGVHPTFYSHVEELDKHVHPLPYAHAVRRAWETLDLAGVLYVDRSPAAYFKQVDSFTDDMARDWQRVLWNHAVCPILVIGTPSEVRVYSGQALPAKPNEPPDAQDRLVTILNRTRQMLEIRQLVQAIESGRLQDEKRESFDRKHSVNEYLLRNLKAVRSHLTGGKHGLKLPQIHRLLTRILFTCYLIEREIIKGDHYEHDEDLCRLSPTHSLGAVLRGKRPTRVKEVLCCLFGSIQSRFNGSLFDPGVVSETRSLKARHLEILQRFLRGDDLEDRQLTLDFWAYDFRVMPIEIISAIYEDFIEAEGPGARRRTGAYYTPPHVAEMVLDIATEDDHKPLLEKRVLDPACGSGVFLVSAFNRMAEEWRSKNPNRQYNTRARELINVLENQIFGLDVSETACRITCFSLYLALLDQLRPPDIQHLEEQGHRLPLLLLPKGESPPPEQPRTIVCGNFFDPKLNLPETWFDLVVGNPPWVSRAKSGDAAFRDWIRAHPQLPVPQQQIAHGFMWEAPKYLSPKGKACLIVPSAVFLNRTDDFQFSWCTHFTIEKIVNLSDLRFFLFPAATHPGTVVRFSGVEPLAKQHWFKYEVPKTDIVTQLGGPVHIHELDTISVRLSDLLTSAQRREAPVFWKTRFWGTPRDVRLLTRLGDIPRLEEIVGTTRSPKQWVKGQGFQVFNPKPDSDVDKIKRKKQPERPWWSEDQLFLDANLEDLGLIALQDDCSPIGKRFPRLLFPRVRTLFEPPMVLVSHGSSKVAFADFPVLFRSSLQSIKGPDQDVELLKFLAAVLDSRLAKYFLFHTAANWGTERDKVHFFELLRMPFPLPKDAPDPSRARDIVRSVCGEMDALKQDLAAGAARFGRSQRVDRARRKIDPMILDYYGVDEWERMLIEDTVKVFARSSTPSASRTKIPTLRKVLPEDREAYVSTLCSILNSMAASNGPRISGTVAYSTSAGQAVVTLRRNGSMSAYAEKESSRDLKEALERISKVLPEDKGSFVRQRGLKVFDGDSIHIAKPLTLRSWTRTAALNDADEIAAAILLRKRGD